MGGTRASPTGTFTSNQPAGGIHANRGEVGRRWFPWSERTISQRDIERTGAHAPRSGDPYRAHRCASPSGNSHRLRDRPPWRHRPPRRSYGPKLNHADRGGGGRLSPTRLGEIEGLIRRARPYRGNASRKLSIEHRPRRWRRTFGVRHDELFQRRLRAPVTRTDASASSRVDRPRRPVILQSAAGSVRDPADPSQTFRIRSETGRPCAPLARHQSRSAKEGRRRPARPPTASGGANGSASSPLPGLPPPGGGGTGSAALAPGERFRRTSASSSSARRRRWRRRRPSSPSPSPSRSS